MRRHRSARAAHGPLAAGALLGALAIVLLSVSAANAERDGQKVERNGEMTHAPVAVPRAAAERSVEVVQVDGLLDPPNRTLVRDAIRAANRDRAQLLVLKIASGGTVDVDVTPLVRAVRTSPVPIAVWVGPAGSKAKGAVGLLAAAAPVTAVSNGSSIGPLAPLRLDVPGATRRSRLVREVETLAHATGRPMAGARAMVDRRLSAAEAARIGATDRVCPSVPGCPTLGELVVNLDGHRVRTPSGRHTLHTAKVIGTGHGRRRQPSELIRFRKLDLTGQVVHTLTSPSIAYLLLVAGLSLIVFEFFTISIGLAGGAGAVALIGAFVGFSHLPVHWWAVVLVLLALFGYGVDVQAGRPYAWTVIATVLLLIASLTLYGGSSRLDVHWWVVALVVVGAAAFFVGAMPVAVRSRFSTPTVGREGLVGELGEAIVPVDPDGVVLVRDARWRARTNRATPIPAGAAIRVVDVQGLVLEVEPESGGARDHRRTKRAEPSDPAHPDSV